MCIRDRSERGQGDPRLRCLNRNGELKVDVGSLRLHWLRDLQELSRHAEGWLEVFVDEIDQIHPDRSHLGVTEAKQLLIAITQLRGMIQSGQPDTGMVRCV